MNALSVLLGILSPFVFILAASPFEVVGKNSFREVLAGSIGLAIYLAVCQYLVARRQARNHHELRPTMIRMGAPLLVTFFIILVVEKPEVVSAQGIPMLLAGGVGILSGAGLALRATTSRKGIS